jgi:DNA repair protein RadD
VIQLRDYQQNDVLRLRAAMRAGHRAIVYVAATGSGKTTSASYMIGGAVSRGIPSIFVAHRKELVDQCSERLAQFGIRHGVIMADDPRADSGALVQVCSIQTLVRRKKLPPAGLIVADEAHHSVSDSWQRILRAYPEAKLIGLTATPCRLDGHGLRDLYSEMVVSLTPRELTERGYLVPARVFAPSELDLKGVHRRGGDFQIDEIQELMDKPSVTGDIVESWFKLGGADRLTITYATGVTHSKHIVEKFIAAGVPAAHLDAGTPKPVRESLLLDLSHGRLRVLSNCGILTEGWDCPPVSHVILARPTDAVSLYLQMVGRALRPFAGKEYCVIQDHVNATRRHGFLTANREWSLDGHTRPGGKRGDDPSVRTCKQCFAAYESILRKCPYCGAVAPVTPRRVNNKRGELVELSEVEVKSFSKNPRIAALQRIAREKGYKPGWLWRQMKALREARADSSAANAA